jgi:uncharacterized protein with beta-barrel porin domain
MGCPCAPITEILCDAAAAVVRTELGSRFDAPTLVCDKRLVLFGRVAWAHDFVDNPALSAEFQTLPGTNFTVFGAPIPHDSACFPPTGR